MTFNDRKSMTISADSRALIRAAIKRNPGWKAYADANNVDLGTMTTRDAIFDCCDALEIDMSAVIAAGRQQDDDEPREPRRGATLLDGADNAHNRAANAAFVKPAPAPQVPAEAAQQLLGLIQSLAPKAEAVDMEQVRDVVATAIGHADERLERRLTEIDSNISNSVIRMITELEAKIQDGPAVRIEIGKAGEFKKLDGHHHPQFAKLLRALSAKQADGHAPNVWIAGPAGSGKTHAARKASEALGVAFHYNGALSMPHELLGFIDAAGHYHRAPFREAYEHGGLYLFDETDGSDNSALLALNAALANGQATFPDGQIERHKDCYIVATGNTWGLGATAEYVGRSKIDAAFLSRFPVRLSWDYDAKLEKAISGNPDFAARVQKARANARKAGVKVLIDPRASIAGAALIAAGFDADEAAELTYLANLTPEQRKMVEA